MHSQRFLRFVVSFWALGLAETARAAEPGLIRQKIIVQQPLRLTADEHAKILHSLAQSEPAFNTLAAKFPNVKTEVFKKGESGRLSLSSTLRVPGYLVSFRISGLFNEDFSQVSELQREGFTAVRIEDLRHLKSGQIAAPIRLSVDEMSAFCADPVAFIERHVQSAAEK